MTSKFITAVDRKLFKLNPQQKWVKANLHYEVIMGSHAYGMNKDDSDMDIYGWCIPPKSYVLPHTEGYIHGFGPKPQGFDYFILHHVKDSSGKEFDFTIYSVVKYLDLVAENNPNMIDSLFVPVNCITHMTECAGILRDVRQSLLHKGAYHKFKGYAYSQIHKMRTKEKHDEMSTKRKESIEQFGYDVKFASHSVRLIDECEQILKDGDIDLQRNNEQLKAIRRGEWTFERVLEHFAQKEKYLEQLYQASKLPERPDWDYLRGILLSILEHHYGSVSEVTRVDRNGMLLAELQKLVDKYS